VTPAIAPLWLIIMHRVSFPKNQPHHDRLLSDTTTTGRILLSLAKSDKNDQLTKSIVPDTTYSKTEQSASQTQPNYLNNTAFAVWHNI
jgi:hypothetical protein